MKSVTPKTVYNRFKTQFQKKPGYIGSLVYNAAGENVFEFELDAMSDVNDAIEYLKKYNVKLRVNKMNKKQFMVIPRK
jgi:hypothetical protein